MRTPQIGAPMTDSPGRALLALQLDRLIHGSTTAQIVLPCAAWALCHEASKPVRSVLARQLRALICADRFALAVMADAAKVLECEPLWALRHSEPPQ